MNNSFTTMPYSDNLLGSRSRAVEFDYDAIDATPAQEAQADGMADLIRALSGFSQFLIDPQARSLSCIDASLVGRRVVMAMWVMRPDVIDNRSLTQLSRELGVSEAALCKIARRFSQRFGIKGRSQFTAATRRRMSNAKSLPKAPKNPERN